MRGTTTSWFWAILDHVPAPLKACYVTMAASGMGPGEYLRCQEQEEQPEEIRITRTDGTEFILQDPQVVAEREELTGTLDGLVGFYIPLADVESIAVQKTDAGAAIGGVFLVIGVIVVVFLLAVCSTDDIGSGECG